MVVAIIVVGVSMRFYRFSAPILDAFTFRQTQTASTVWLWDRFGFDFFSYRVPMFGAGHWVLELPVYQAIVWLLSQPFGGIEAAGRLVSIAAFVAAAALLYLIVKEFLGSRSAGVFSVAVFTFLPIDVFYYRAVLIDPLFIATTLLSMYAALRLVRRFTWTWMAVLGVAVPISVLGKASIVLAIGLPILVLALRLLAARTTPNAGKLALVGIGVATLALMVAWTRHGDALNLASGALTLSNGGDWYFGSTFSDAELFRIVGQRFLDNLGVVGVLLVGLGLVSIPSVRTRFRPELVVLVAGGFLSIGILANLNRVHDYYQLPYYVTLSIFAGLGLDTLYRGLAAVSQPLARQVAAGILVALAVICSLATWNTYFAPKAVAYNYLGQALEMRAATPDRRLLVVQDNADKNEPMLWYEARRVGWRVPIDDPAEADRIVRDAPDLGGVVFLRGALPEPSFVARIVTARGFQRTFESPAMVVYTDPNSS